MKKLIVMLMALLSVSLYAQQNYPHNKPELLLNKKVTIRPMVIDALRPGYANFYEDEYKSKTYKKIDYNASDAKELVDRSFIVTDVKGPNSYNLYTITLKDPATGELIYYDYKLKYVPNLFPFVVEGGLDLPEDFYATYVKYELNGKSKRWSIPDDVGFETDGGISIEKDNISGVGESYKLVLYGDKNSEPTKIKGPLLVTFEDGTTITRKTADLFAFPPHNHFYWGIISLTKAELEQVKTKRIKSFRVNNAHYYNDDLEYNRAERIRGIANYMAA